jgi:hemin uptake protein HemP
VTGPRRFRAPPVNRAHRPRHPAAVAAPPLWPAPRGNARQRDFPPRRTRLQKQLAFRRTFNNNANTNHSQQREKKIAMHNLKPHAPASATALPVASLTTMAPAAPLQVVRRISSASLMQDRREVEIEHAGRIYRLRVTQLNKLILTA